MLENKSQWYGCPEMVDARFRWTFTLTLAALVVFALVDLVMDSGEHGIDLHVAVEAAMIFTALGALAYLWSGFSLRLRRAELRAADLDSELAEFRARNVAALAELRRAIQQQFDRWRLTPAERRLAEGLIRGRSLKEIAAQSGRSEQTIRNQCTSLYARTGMVGRSDLAAFFLSDLLGEDPAESSDPESDPETDARLESD
jgi:DNA-binding CsgD family transcriptional regulator